MPAPAALPASGPPSPAPDRPHAAGMAARAGRRIGRRLAAGLTPAEAAAVEGVSPAEVEALLEEPAFQELVEAMRAVRALGAEAARARLLALARELLEEAVIEGDLRVALFIHREETRGRDPAASLTDGVLRRREPQAAREPRRPRPSRAAAGSRARRVHPADRLAWSTAARLRRELVLAEGALRRAALAARRQAGGPARPRPPVTAAQWRYLAALAREAAPPGEPPVRPGQGGPDG